MRDALLEHLACPACGAKLRLDAHDQEGPHVMSGVLTCTECSARYAIASGVPRLNIGISASGLDNVQRTFDWEWQEHHNGTFEHDTLFGRTADEDWAMFLEGTCATPADLENGVVLDAGCGSGAFTRLVAERSEARAVIGVDMVEAVEAAFESTRHLENVHIVQGNVFALPFACAAFDLIWCNGVIHHTPDARGAHRSLCKHVKPGGILYVWVYAARFNPFRFTKDVMDALRVTRLREPALLRLVTALSYASLGMLGVYRAARLLPILRPRTRWGVRTVRPRTIDELKLTWFDALSPEYDSRHSEAEVIGWFREQRFTDLAAIDEPKVGVRGVALAPAE